jgi:undecaprenyl-diphosphatase
MVGGVLTGLKYKDSARFSFLLATPIIAGAGVLEVPKLMHQGSGGLNPLHVILAGVTAGVTAYLSTAFLMRYFKNHEIAALEPFAWYCWVFGAAALLILLI